MSNAHTQVLMPTHSPSMHWLRSQGAALRNGLARLGRAVWLALAANAQRRAQRELLILAERWKHENPKLAQELRSYARGGSSY